MATAKAYCTGIIQRLQQYSEESNSDLKDWLTDVSGDYIGTVFKEREEENPDNDDIAEVLSTVKGGKSWA